MADAIRLEFLHETPRGVSFSRLVDLVAEMMPSCVTRGILEESLRDLAGQPLTAELIKQTAWRICGNVTRLRHRRAVPPWHVQRLPEWAPLQIISCRRSKSNKGVPGATFGICVLAGTAAGLVLLRWWSLKQCRYRATDFGFSRPVSLNAKGVARYPYQAPEQLVNLRLYGLLEPRLCVGGPMFEICGFVPAVVEHNRRLIQFRERVQKSDCPMGFAPNEPPCHRCPVGYEQCPGGTHKRNWTQAECPRCKNPAAAIDPDMPDECIDCRAKALYRRNQP